GATVAVEGFVGTLLMPVLVISSLFSAYRFFRFTVAKIIHQNAVVKCFGLQKRFFSIYFNNKSIVFKGKPVITS
ncbi:hypothetical protein, partial [Phocaeicola sp.]